MPKNCLKKTQNSDLQAECSMADADPFSGWTVGESQPTRAALDPRRAGSDVRIDVGFLLSSPDGEVFCSFRKQL